MLSQTLGVVYICVLLPVKLSLSSPAVVYVPFVSIDIDGLLTIPQSIGST